MAWAHTAPRHGNVGISCSALARVQDSRGHVQAFVSFCVPHSQAPPVPEPTEQKPEPVPPPVTATPSRIARTSQTSVAAAHMNSNSSWPPPARVGSPTPPVPLEPQPGAALGAPSPSPAKAQPSAPARGPSVLRLQMLRADSTHVTPPAQLQLLPGSPRTSDVAAPAAAAMVVPPPPTPKKQPSWTLKDGAEAAQAKEEATYRLTLSGPKLKSHRVCARRPLVPRISFSAATPSASCKVPLDSAQQAMRPE